LREEKKGRGRSILFFPGKEKRGTKGGGIVVGEGGRRSVQGEKNRSRADGGGENRQDPPFLRGIRSSIRGNEREKGGGKKKENSHLLLSSQKKEESEKGWGKVGVRGGKGEEKSEQCWRGESTAQLGDSASRVEKEKVGALPGTYPPTIKRKSRPEGGKKRPFPSRGKDRGMTEKWRKESLAPFPSSSRQAEEGGRTRPSGER